MPHVSMGMITIDHSPAPIGFHLDMGFGETLDAIHSGNRDPKPGKYFKAAYISALVINISRRSSVRSRLWQAAAAEIMAHPATVQRHSRHTILPLFHSW